MRSVESVTVRHAHRRAAAKDRTIGRTLMPLCHAAYSAGTVLRAGLGALMQVVGVPVSAHLAIVGFRTFVAGPAFVRALQSAETPAAAQAGGGGADGWRARTRVWRDRRVLLIGLIMLGIALAQGAADDWLSLTMVDGHGLDKATGAACLAIFMAAVTAARAASVRAVDRWGLVLVLRFSAALAAVGLLLEVFATTPIAVVGIALWGLGAAAGFLLRISVASDDPATATASVSAVATMGYLAFLIGPPLIGVLGQRLGLLHALLSVLVFVVLAAVCSRAAAKVPRPRTMSSGPDGYAAGTP